MKDNMFLFFKWAFSACGAAAGFLLPTVPFALICLFGIAIDCWTAYSLARRVRKNHPDANDGKFKSKHYNRIFDTILKIYALIVFAFLIDRFIIPFEGGLFLPNIVSGMFCFGQLWSILENESSENSAKWAVLLQRFMVNKAERHFDIPIRDLFSDKDDIQT
jgi:hypothetical protein